jgi:hypothetical protein
MSDRPLRLGDRVTATGTVMDTRDVEYAVVRWDGDGVARRSAPYAILTLIEPAEPPAGSVVVKDGVAWTRMPDDYFHSPLGPWLSSYGDQEFWPGLSDGEVIFTAGGDA